MKPNPPRISVAALAAALAGAAVLSGGLLGGLSGSAWAQSCTTIGSSTFCGARGSHNTVGNTVIFNNGPAGQRIGSIGLTTGTSTRTEVLGGGRQSTLSAPRGFAGVAAPKRFIGSGAASDSGIAALRAEILANEAQYQLQHMDLTPAQKAAQNTMPPALVRALALAKQARAKEAATSE